MRFLSGGFDLGVFDQSVWQYSQFLYPFNTVKMRMILGDHMTLTLPLLAPLYWLWNNVTILLLFQAAWISFSGLAIFKYLQIRKFTSLQSGILTLLYLLFYGIQFAIYFDFHPVIIGVGLLVWIAYFWEAKRWKLFAIFSILLLLTQENMGIGLLGLSIIWFFQGRNRKLALLMGAIGLISSFAAFQAIRLFNNGALEYTPVLPQNITGYITQFFDSSEKREVWLYSLSWYSFLPLFSPPAMLAVILDLSQYFLTGENFSRMWSPFMHHRAILSVFLLIGTADVLIFLKSKKLNITYVVIIMLAVSLFLQWNFHFALNKLIKKDFIKTESWMKDNENVLAKVPKGESVATQQSLVPHLSHRKEIYLVYPRKRGDLGPDICPKEECWWLYFAGKPKYLVVDAHDSAWLTMLLVDITEFREAIVAMEKTNTIKKYYQQGDAVIYKILKY
jgi:uncharacterized membrane protein